MSSLTILLPLAAIAPAVLLRPVWGVALLVAVSLLGALPVRLLEFDLDRVVGMLVFVSAWAWILLARRGRWRRSILDGPALLLLGAGLLAIAGRALVGSQVLQESLLEYISLAMMAGLALLAFQFLSTWQRITRILQTFIVTAVAVTLVSVVALLSGMRTVALGGAEINLVAGWGAVDRLGGLYQQPNHLAAIMTLALPTALVFQVLATTHARRGFWTCAAGIILAGLLLSQARSAILGAALGSLLLGVLLWRCRALRLANVAWAVMGLVFATWLLVQTGVANELGTRLTWTHQLEAAASDPSQDRLRIWQSALAVAASNPLGLAAEGSVRIGADLDIEARSAHNVFLSYLVAYGFLGAAAVAWLAWRQLVGLGMVALRSEGASYRVLAAGLLAALVGFWVHNLAHSIIQWLAIWVYFACAAAVVRLGRARSPE